MINNVIVACSDNEVRRIVFDKTSVIFGEKKIQICKNYNDMYEKSKYAKDAAIIFDKYFLGYVISYRLTGLKTLNHGLIFYFVEIGECSRYFGLRIYGLGTNGFIPDIENEEVWKNLNNVLQNGSRTFPEPILESIRKRDCNLDERSVSEVTANEMQIGMYLGMGKSQKDICSITGFSQTAISVYTHRLKRKIGYKNPNDYFLLNRQFFNNKMGGDFDY